MTLQSIEELAVAKKFVYAGPAYEFLDEHKLEEKLKFVPLGQYYGKTEDEALAKLILEAKDKGCYFISNYKKEEKYSEFRCSGMGVAPTGANTIIDKTFEDEK